MFSVQGKNIISKMDYSGNETKIQAVITCDRDYKAGEKICIETAVTDHSFLYNDEKISAEENNARIQAEQQVQPETGSIAE